MSLLAIILLSVFFIFMFSEFGHRLQARNAGLWILMATFISFAALKPQLFRPLADALGVALISNLVLALLVMFLFLQVYELSAELTSNNRKMRRVVSNLAAEKFCRRSPSSENRSSQRSVPKVLVVFPCFNEEGSVVDVVKRIREVSEASKDFQIDYCFVDDGSSDSTSHLLKAYCPENHVTHSVNIGVSGVLMTGFQIMRRETFDYLVQCDSDGQHPVEKIPNLLAKAMLAGPDLLIGSRFFQDDLEHGKRKELTAAQCGTTRGRILGISLIRLFLSMFQSAGRLTDPTSGFRVYSRRACDILWPRLPDEYPEPESIAILSVFGANVREVSVQMESRVAGTSSLSGLKSARYMIKVSSALVGLRLRGFMARVN